MASTLSTRVRGWIVSIAILGTALGLIFVLSSNWTTWARAGEEQETDDAYLRADVTPLSTKAAGLVASVEVSDYQPVKEAIYWPACKATIFGRKLHQTKVAIDDRSAHRK
jgi:hypothetical protein